MQGYSPPPTILWQEQDKVLSQSVRIMWMNVKFVTYPVTMCYLGRCLWLRSGILVDLGLCFVIGLGGGFFDHWLTNFDWFDQFLPEGRSICLTCQRLLTTTPLFLCCRFGCLFLPSTRVFLVITGLLLPFGAMIGLHCHSLLLLCRMIVPSFSGRGSSCCWRGIVSH